MYRFVLALAWFVGTVYATIPLFWLMVHPFAARLRARRSPLLMIVPAWFAMMGCLHRNVEVAQGRFLRSGSGLGGGGLALCCRHLYLPGRAPEFLSRSGHGP